MKRKTLLIIPLLAFTVLGSCNFDPDADRYKDKMIEVVVRNNSDSYPDKHFSFVYGSTLPEFDIPTRDYSLFHGFSTIFNGHDITISDLAKYRSGFDRLIASNYEIDDNYTVYIDAFYDSETINVNIHNDSESSKDCSLEVEYYEDIPILTAPEKDLMLFEYYYTIYGDQELKVFENGNYVNNMAKLTKTNYVISERKSVDIYAKYTSAIKEVTLVLPDESSRKASVPYNSKIDSYVSEVTYNGYSVTKWSTIPNDAGHNYVFDEPVIKDITLYASEYRYYRVTFDMGPNTKSYLKLPGETVEVPHVPTKTGYISDGFKDREGNIVSGTLEVYKSAVYKYEYKLFTGVKKISKYPEYEIYTPRANEPKDTYREWKEQFTFGNYYDLAALKEAGYDAFKCNVTASLNVIHDGYQNFFIYSPNNELHHKKYDYDADDVKDISYTTNIAFAELASDQFLLMRFSASGSFNILFYDKGNNWCLGMVAVEFEPIKL